VNTILVPLALCLLAQPQPPQLPAPTKSAVKFSKVVGWPADKKPIAPDGFAVTLFADGLDSPRWMYQLPNGDVLVAESKTEPKPLKEAEAKPEQKEGVQKAKMAGKSANRITLFRTGADGKVERFAFAEGLKQPLGMALIGDALFVANTNAVVRFAYKDGQTKLEGKGQPVLDLPEGGYNNHWTRNVLPNKDGTKLYVSVGSASNVAERGTAEEMLRACILEANLDGTGLRVFASGLRNPVGMDWEPTTRTLWTAVNERDELGDELVPDYLTSVKDGAFYGWPYSYFGQIEDPRRKGERPDLVAKAVVPDVPVGSHTASLGLAFYRGEAFPAKYRGGAFVGQHGSWNRSEFSGYKVVFVPFKEGKPAGGMEDFLTGFMANADEVYGRPVGVTVLKDGSLLVADDAGNRIWRITAGAAK
jgi:glucose/arabinose dehydrogenase